MKIIFFGTSDFAAKILLHLIEKKIPLSAVVTQSDRNHYGRSLLPPVKQVVLEYLPSTPLFQPNQASDPRFLEDLKQFPVDFFVVVAYGQLLKQPLLDLPRKAPINIHASLLPKYRGAAPIQRALMQGERETGITLIKMSAQMDAGDILAATKIAVDSAMVFGELEAQLCQKAKDLLVHALTHYDSLHLVAQDHSLATFAPKISPEECLIDWRKEAQVVHNLVRALSPKPGAFFWAWFRKEKKRVKVFHSQVVSEKGIPGKILLFSKEKLLVGCREGTLSIRDVQIEGKRKMSLEEFYCGHKENFSLLSFE